MIIKIFKIDWQYRKCDHCLRKGKSQWMHGNSTKDGRMASVTGDFCSKHNHIFKEKVREVFGAGAL